MKVRLFVLIFVMAFIWGNASASPVISFDLDFYTNGANVTDNYAKGVFDTGQTITLKTGESVWLDLYVSGFNEEFNGLSAFGIHMTWENSVLNWQAPLTVKSVFKNGFSDPSLQPGAEPVSKIGAGYLDLSGLNFSAPEGDNILLATFQLVNSGSGTSPITLSRLHSGDYQDWATFLGDNLDPQLANPITLGVVSNPVPIPAAIWIFASGLLGLIGLRRKS
jgi:hypothetical protein